MIDPTPAKAAMRAEFRRRRRSVVDDGRSERICDTLAEAVRAVSPSTVMVYVAFGGEPDLALFVDWCRDRGVATVAPSPIASAVDPIDPAVADVVVVPGLAFTTAGHRLGQGGGWYDRFLARTRPQCVKIGVGFDIQLVDDLPTEAHDVTLDLVVTESGVVGRSSDVGGFSPPRSG